MIKKYDYEKMLKEISIDEKIKEEQNEVLTQKQIIDFLEKKKKEKHD